MRSSINVPEKPEAGAHQKSTEAALADHIEESLTQRTGKFELLANSLKAMLAEDGVKFTASHVPIALEMLVNQERLSWPPGTGNKPRPGHLIGGSEWKPNHPR